MTVVGIAVAWALLTPVEAAEYRHSPSAQVLGPYPIDDGGVFRTYCITCHNKRLRTAGLELDALDLSDVRKNPELWEKVARKLRASAMPPAGRPRPTSEVVGAFVSSIEAQLDRAAAAHPNLGRTEVFHRLNRTEYHNAIRDLLDIDLDVSTILAADDANFGFDNIADLLTISPALLDRYLSAARKLSPAAVGLSPSGPEMEIHRISDGLRQDGYVSEDLPFGSRGGAAVRHRFPSDGEYVIKVALRRDSYELPIGLGVPEQLELRIDGALVKRFAVGGGEALQGAAPIGFIGSVAGTEAFEAYLQSADDHLQVPVPIKAGDHLIGVSFVDRWRVEEGVLQPTNDSYREPDDELFSKSGIASISVNGPYNAQRVSDTSSRRKIFVCQPRGASDETRCAKRILSTLARRAYRGFATNDDIDVLLGFYRDGRSTGDFNVGIQFAIQRLLVDPKFLVRIERDPSGLEPGSVYRLSDLELASRLSFFLWSSIPDDTLLDVAARGGLRNPRVLERQVRRMLVDPRAKALVENFAGQWLELRNLRDVSPDPRIFTDFDDNLRLAFMRETELFIEAQLREDRSVLELLGADYSFLNERLASHYGVPNVFGDGFRRVMLPKEQRGGLLGQGSILTVTSPPERTSPVFRGKWILQNILNTPPPPPPRNVPALADKGAGGKTVSVRERLEQHRQNPVCASCHAPMDPLGFALEHFDAIGRWRTLDGGTAIDASGVMPDGTTFVGLGGLRDTLLADPESFARTVTEKLMVYAIGRALQHYDGPAVRAILRNAASSNYRWSDLILGVVSSPAFQMRTTLSEVTSEHPEAVTVR